MPNLLQTLQQISQQATAATDPVEIVFGTVRAFDPFTVRVGDKLRLPGKALLFTHTSTNLAYRIGDTVIMLREQGGQRYLVLDKAGSAP